MTGVQTCALPIFQGQGRFEETIEDFSLAIRYKPDLAKAYLLRGQAYEQDGQTENALSDYEKYRQFAPNDPQARQLVEKLRRTLQ